MRRTIILLLLLALLSPSSLFAGIYGTLKGKVVDEEGKPLVKATIRVLGTSLGANSQKDGTFKVLSINPGSYVVKVTFMGYKEYKTNVKISTDDISEITVTMISDSKLTGEIVVSATGEKMVRNTDIGKTVTRDGDEMRSIAREGVAAIVGLTAGVFNAGDGFVVRGSRTNETQIRLDGLDVGNQFQGGFGGAGMNYYPMISQYATEEVQVLTGGFSAEYGNALGGVVNTVPRTGRNDKYEGYLRWSTDVPSLWGSSANGLKVVNENNRLKAVNDGDGYKYQGPGQHKVEFGAGGPIPLIDKATFYISSSYLYEKYRNNSYEIYDPDGNNLGQLEGQQSWVKNITGYMKFVLGNDIDLIVGGMWGLTNLETGGWSWLYAKDEGVINGVSNGMSESKAKQIVYNNLVSTIKARINHKINQNMFYEFTVSRTANNDYTARRKNSDDPGYFSGFELIEPQDKYMVKNGTLVYGSEKIIDQYTPLTKFTSTKDGYLIADFPQINPLTGYIEGSASTNTSVNAYGVPTYFYAHGNSNGFEFRKGNYWQADGSLTWSIDGEFQHMFKSGFEFRLYEMHRHSNSLPWDGNPFFDVYTDEWSGNIYQNDVPDVYEKTSKPYKPWRGSAYIQDQITYKGIIFSPGLRYDIFNPNASYRTSTKYFQPITSDTGFADAKTKMQLSPRINITYPITERSNVSISYGIYFQMPELQFMYDAFAVAQLRGNANLGDPNMEAQRTNAYQVSYTNQISDDFAIDVQAYYKDIYNQVGIIYVPSVPTPYYQYAVAEYGNSRGIELTLRKRATDHLGFEVNYNLSKSSGTSSSAGDNYMSPVDPYTDLQALPLSEYATSNDRRHRINATTNIFWGDGQGPSIANFKPLENFQINLSGFFQTGTPYTRLDKAGNTIGEYNAEREPSYWSCNLRVSKSFLLKDFFGESAGQSSFEIFVYIENLFNNRQVAGYYARTGDADDDGVNFYRKSTDFSTINYYEEANYGKAESWNSSQYDAYGNRLYSSKSDKDNDGIVTQLEKYDAFVQYLEDARKFRGNYAAPRSVYFGLMFRF